MTAQVLGLSLALATNSLALLSLWLPTPSYNSLALQAHMVAGIGMLLAERDSYRSNLAGCVVIDFAGWLFLRYRPLY